MLLKDKHYIPEPETEKPRAFTADLSGLIAWLETQDGSKDYLYWSSNCLLVQFCIAAGKDADFYFDKFDRSNRIEDRVARPEPHTFGHALTRARSLRSA